MVDDLPTPIKMYAIYEHPRDYPEGYVVREWLVRPAETQPGDSWRAATLEEAHALLPPGVERTETADPDPTIVETWI